MCSGSHNGCHNEKSEPVTQLIIERDVPLADKNWFGTGGPARFWCEPATGHEFSQAISFAHDEGKEIFLLGQGANILVNDEGFDGLVIRPKLLKLATVPFDSCYALVQAGAGVSMSDLISYCFSQNLRGLEEFSGIPGTVGGSVFINLHYFNFLLSQFLVSAQVVERATGKILEVDNAWFEFGYNHSKLVERNHFLMSATFKLERATASEIAYAQGRRAEIIRHRQARYPNARTCGSFFRNFHDDEVTLVSNGKKMIFVAYYLDKIGVKGALGAGGAQVSYQHANMIVNQGSATTADIIGIARRMQELVAQQFGVLPQPECLLVGFKEYPLYRTADMPLQEPVTPMKELCCG